MVYSVMESVAIEHKKCLNRTESEPETDEFAAADTVS